jgi:basic amino acid/polyamine antiporter, APA family
MKAEYGSGSLGSTAHGNKSHNRAGIFILTGIAAASYSGPALILSFALAGICLCVHCPMLLRICIHGPLAGSAYTYIYVILGEIWAWIIGWDLILEYLVIGTGHSILFTTYY